jgi:hypothetical protein
LPLHSSEKSRKATKIAAVDISASVIEVAGAWRSFGTRNYRPDFSFQQQLTETIRLIGRYQDTPMSFADACLVRMAELRDKAIILTTDTDFQIYRKRGRQVIPLLIRER